MKRFAFTLATLAIAAAAHAQVTVKDAWVRATVPQQKATGAFMNLTSPTDTALVSASSPVAGLVEVHEMAMDGGVMKMRAVPQLPLTIVGVVLQIDYPSRTFRMRGPHTAVVVSVDDNTDIFFQMNRKQFNDLKPGTKISMHGNGSLATGFTARHIQIIGGP